MVGMSAGVLAATSTGTTRRCVSNEALIPADEFEVKLRLGAYKEWLVLGAIAYAKGQLHITRHSGWTFCGKRGISSLRRGAVEICPQCFEDARAEISRIENYHGSRLG